MNKSLKIILAIAIGVIYPIMVLFIALVLFPSTEYEKLNDNSPRLLNKSECTVNGNLNGLNASRNQACDKKNVEIDEYELNQIKFKSEEYNEIKNQIITKRLAASLIAALLGFIIAMVAYRFSPITVGMSGGSTVLILFSSVYSLMSNQTTDPFITSLFSLSFVVLIAMLFFIDKVMPLPIRKDFIQDNKDIYPKKIT